MTCSGDGVRPRAGCARLRPTSASLPVRTSSSNSRKRSRSGNGAMGPARRKQFPAALPLTVLWIFDLHPRGGFRRVEAVLLLGYHALQVAFDRGFKQLDPMLGHVVGVQDAAGLLRNERPENALALEQGPGPQIAPIEGQHIEGVEPRLGSMPEEVVELRTSVFIEADDLAVQYHIA